MRWIRCPLSLCGLALVLLAALAGTARPQEDDRLDAGVRNLLARRSFARSLLPGKPFKPEEKDPLLMEVVWETVRPELEEFYRKELRLARRPDLHLRFFDAGGDGEARRVRAGFSDPGDARVRRSLTSALSLPAESFARDLLVYRPVTRTFEIVTREVRVKAVEPGKLEEALRDALTGPKSPLKRLKLAPLEMERPDRDLLLLRTAWVFLEEDRDSGDTFHWRYFLHLANNVETEGPRVAEGLKEQKGPLLRAGIEVGRKRRGTRAPEVIALKGKAEELDRYFQVRFARFEGVKAGTRLECTWQQYEPVVRPSRGSADSERGMAPLGWTSLTQGSIPTPPALPPRSREETFEEVKDRFKHKGSSSLVATASAISYICCLRIEQETGWHSIPDSTTAIAPRGE